MKLVNHDKFCFALSANKKKTLLCTCECYCMISWRAIWPNVSSTSLYALADLSIVIEGKITKMFFSSLPFSWLIAEDKWTKDRKKNCLPASPIQITYIDSVCREITRQWPASILNMKGSSVLLVRRALFGVVFVVKQTSDVRKGAFLARYPQIWRAGVKHDFEGLWRRSNWDCSEILRIEIVWKRLWKSEN